MRATQELQERVARIDELVQKLDSSADPALRATAKELVRSLMDLHGAGLERILEIVSQTAGEVSASVMQSLGHDDLVSSLLVLYDLHPEDFETRAHRALDKVRPMLRSHDARLENIVIGDSTIRARITGPAPEELTAAVREALLEAVPDAVEVIIEGSSPRAGSSGFVPLASLLISQGSAVNGAESGPP